MSIPIPSTSKSGEIICRDARVIVFPFFDANINQREERKSGSAEVERGWSRRTEEERGWSWRTEEERGIEEERERERKKVEKERRREGARSGGNKNAL